MTRADFNKKKKKIPDAPGVYFFLGSNKKILYIGKAASLRNRIRSYFSDDLSESRSPLIVRMVLQARSIDWRKTDSVLEALILEANLIKTYRPQANTDQKDGKSFNYVLITNEIYPQILLVRGKELQSGNTQFKAKKIFGPFPHGMQLKEAMKIIRKIFPYRDAKCMPGQGRPCFNRQIGLCPGVCTAEVSATEYARSVRHLVLFFEGKKKVLLQDLERNMKRAAAQEAFEKAGEFRRQIFALKHIQDISLIKNEYHSPHFSGAASYRIESYDVAHLGGTSTVGVMVVLENGEPSKQEYRTFHIRSAKAGDDAGALREILSRRLAHDEWQLPRLIVVDGATQQIHAAEGALLQARIRIPIVGVVKDDRHRPRELRGDTASIREHEHEILLANQEAHRFAVSRHTRLRRKQALLA